MIARRQALLKAFKLFDILVMVLCFAAASWVSYFRDHGLESFEQFLAMRVKVVNFLLFIVLTVLWHAFLNSFHLYQSHRLSSRWHEISGILKATLLGTFLLFILGKAFNVILFTPAFLAVFFTANSLLLAFSRIVLRHTLGRIRRRGINLRHMLIVGTGRRAVAFARKITSRPELGYKIAGFVDANWEGIGEFRKSGFQVVSDYEGFPAYIRKNVVDEVVIALPLKSGYEIASRLAELSQEQGIIVRSLSDIFDLKASKISAATMDGLSLVSNYSGAMEGWQAEVKRLLDILVSAVGLLMAAPVFVAVALAIKLTSRGPVFFIQERVGLGKRRFCVYKFRTMVDGAEKKQAELEALNEQTGAVFKIKNDPRITPVGRILRKFSIDELPQFINVLIGDMSLVGPRPLPVRDYSAFNEDWHRRRFSVRPGITCLWQTKGRSAVPFERWMELDMEYIDRWSLWLDFKILAKTVPSVLRGSGAA